ncbi:hypothetical protein [Streptacidiphilus cavernicola]|uniref:MftR C-terminal domain-containing protein n=1 Tax=Streptacidiphilus cavernicola TaxID=3342716 RepID=A0ABV6VY37_9ACTN
MAQGILATINEGTERVDDGVLFLAAELVEDVPVDMHVRRTLIGLYDLTTQLSHRPHGPVEALRPVASALLIAYRSLVAGQQPDQIAGALEPVIAALGAAPR